MAKLYFRYSSMNAGKSLELISTHYNYLELGKNPVAYVPNISGNTIRSRVGCEIEAIPFDKDFRFNLDNIMVNHCDCILIDEAQFLTREQVIELHKLTAMQAIPVICYGLRTDFRGEPFEGSGMLLALADELQELPTLCHCGKKARMVLRTVNDKVITEGEQVAIKDTNDKIKYYSVCSRHFYLRKPCKEVE
ncbi:MAG: thymidine kinase [Anaerocolumna sp.]|jgi:thymidine kinase|nr:thymidine kinase [Anaerocolumna sp.]